MVPTTHQVALHSSACALTRPSRSTAGSNASGFADMFPWIDSWNQQSLANSFSTMSMVPPAVTD
jgi:hypothetical protein